MRIKTSIAAVVILLVSQTVGAQFNRLNDLTNRLANEAAEFAESSYRSQSSGFRGNRGDVEAMMLAHQFGAAAQLFNRMVNDRRRNQDLRDAFQMVQDLGRSIERSNVQRNNWFNIQRTMTDISRELNLSNLPDSGQYPDSSNRSGRMSWKGRVDDDVRITIRGGQADVETIGGTAYYDATTNFTASLPPRRVNVSLNAKRGRGEVFIEQQPSRENNFAVVVRIKDPRGGASDYEFELSW
jgi:hypothetical protein